MHFTYRPAKTVPYLSRKYWSTAKRSHQDKRVGNHFEHPKDDPKGKVQDVLCKGRSPATLYSRQRLPALLYLPISMLVACASRLTQVVKTQIGYYFLLDLKHIPDDRPPVSPPIASRTTGRYCVAKESSFTHAIDPVLAFVARGVLSREKSKAATAPPKHTFCLWARKILELLQVSEK